MLCATHLSSASTLSSSVFLPATISFTLLSMPGSAAKTGSFTPKNQTDFSDHVFTVASTTL